MQCLYNLVCCPCDDQVLNEAPVGLVGVYIDRARPCALLMGSLGWDGTFLSKRANEPS